MTTLAYARRWTDGDDPKCEIVLMRDGELFEVEITEMQAINMAQELIAFIGSLRRESSK